MVLSRGTSAEGKLKTVPRGGKFRGTRADHPVKHKLHACIHFTDKRRSTALKVESSHDAVLHGYVIHTSLSQS
jgi:hypothetical protein